MPSIFGIYLALLLLVLDAAGSDFRKSCQKSLTRGRFIIETHVPAMVEEEMARVQQQLTRTMKSIFSTKMMFPNSLGLGKYMVQSVGNGQESTTPPPCPAPNGTMFPTPSPTKPPTESANLCTTSVTIQPLAESMTSLAPSKAVESPKSAQAPSEVKRIDVAEGDSCDSHPELSEEVQLNGTASRSTRTNAASPTVTEISEEGAAVTSDFKLLKPAVVTGASSDASQTSASSGATTSRALAQEQCVAAHRQEETSKTVTKKKPFRIPVLYSSDERFDPLHAWMTSIYEYLFKTKEICEGPSITDLNSITEDQFYGFLATLGAVHPGPFCTLCNHFISELRHRVFERNPLWEEDEQFLMKLLYAKLPSPKAFCSAAAPGCYDNYEARSRNITEALVCLECTACMTITNVIQHHFLLDKEAVEFVLQFLRSSLFHNTCAELCLVFQPLNLTLFPNGFTYDGCMNFLADSYRYVIKIATVILRPERFCMLELKWCELGETPNILHCLRELCVESLKETPQTAWLCSQIPDTPSIADQFLNVHHTKRYKSRRPYHDMYESGVVKTPWHEESQLL